MKSQLNWKEILDWDEDYIEDLRVTAFLYIREGQYEIARTFCEALAILNPDELHDQATLGALYLQINKPIQALTYLDKAYSMDPKNNLVEMNRIKAMLQLGYRQEGLKLLNSFILKCKDPYMSADAEALKLAYRM